MNLRFKTYIEKIRTGIKNHPVKKAFDLIKDFINFTKLTEEELKKTAPLSYDLVLEFKRNFETAVRKDMANIDKKMPDEKKKELETIGESRNIYNEKFDIGTYIELAPVIFYTFAFLIFIGEEPYEKFKIKIYAFLDRTLGKYYLDKEDKKEEDKDKKKSK